MTKNTRKKTANRDAEMALYLAKKDLLAFAMMCFGIVNPGKECKPNWHVEAILYQLSLASNGERPRLIINVAPRSLKSFLCSVVLPAWILGHNPSANILCMSYSDDLGKTLARQFRKIVGSRKYQSLFPAVGTGDKNTEGEFTTAMGGSRVTTSVGGTLTGKGADYIFIDDPIKAEDARSDHARKKVNEWFDETVYSRLDDKEKSVCVIVMQRLHENDLTGHLEKGRGFHKLSLPSIAEEDAIIPLGGGRVHARKTGDILHPERESHKALEDVKQNLGSLAFASQYQQKPLPAAGNLIQRKWIKYYDTLPETTGIWVWSWDTASSISQSADYSVGTLWFLTDRDRYLVEVVRGKYAFNELRNLIIRCAREGDTHAVLIENADSGRSLIQSFWHDNCNLNIIPRPSGDGKIPRAEKQSCTFEAGRVFFPRNAPWLATVLDEALIFPNGTHDDVVDSITHLLEWAADRRFEGRMRALRGERPKSPHRRVRRSNVQYIGGLDALSSHFRL